MAEPKIEYIGSATSHFQAEPVIYDLAGLPLPPLSDWEFELSKNLAGQHSHISNKQDLKLLPRFLATKDRYIEQSRNLGENIFRFSLDFGRLCPAPDKFDEKLMTEYVKLIIRIKIEGEKPFITLQHFTMPKFLIGVDKKSNRITSGGWEHPKVLEAWRFYIKNVLRFFNDEKLLREIMETENIEKDVAERLISGGLVKFFITLNEPQASILLSYVTGLYPPYRRGKFLASRSVLKKMTEAHDIAFLEIKKVSPESSVGIGYAWPYFDGPLGFLGRALNRYYLKKFERDNLHSDFIGLHYYFRLTPIFRRKRYRVYGDHPSFGDIYPEGILSALRQIHKTYPKKEIFISEIGFADSTDKRKPYWLARTIEYILEARDEGIPIKGIILWSLVDNFEWEFGFTSVKFGLFQESELGQPLRPSEDGIRSWEVWQAAIEVIKNSTPESLEKFEECLAKAKGQYQASLAKRSAP